MKPRSLMAILFMLAFLCTGIIISTQVSAAPPCSKFIERALSGEDVIQKLINWGCVDTTDKYVFVTSTVSTAGLGGLDGADAICQARANEANLAGTWTAWVSASNQDGSFHEDARERITLTTGTYFLLGNMPIANGFLDLLDGSIMNSIFRDEYGSPISSEFINVWTATQADGSATVDDSLDCQEWTSQSHPDEGITGRTNFINASWTHFAPSGCHLGVGRLYCFED